MAAPHLRDRDNWSNNDFNEWLRSLQYRDQEHLVRQLSGFFNGIPPNEWFRQTLRACWPSIERPRDVQGLIFCLQRVRFVGPKHRAPRPKETLTLYRGNDSYGMGHTWTTSIDRARQYAMRYQEVGVDGYVMKMELPPDLLLAMLRNGDEIDYIPNPSRTYARPRYVEKYPREEFGIKEG
jgi:hypothetical protein